MKRNPRIFIATFSYLDLWSVFGIHRVERIFRFVAFCGRIGKQSHNSRSLMFPVTYKCRRVLTDDRRSNTQNIDVVFLFFISNLIFLYALLPWSMLETVRVYLCSFLRYSRVRTPSVRVYCTSPGMEGR